jgi:lactate racemase
VFDSVFAGNHGIMKVTLAYGKTQKIITISDRADVKILAPVPMPAVKDLDETLLRSLEASFGILAKKNRPAPRSVAVAVPDPSRPLPFQDMLPLLLSKLHKDFPNLRREMVKIVIGGGLHPPMSGDQASRWIPEVVAAGAQVIVHDARTSPTVFLGVTRRGTPVEVNADYAGADLKIVIGQIDPHQFVGFTGGAKGVVIGCASERTIEHNHGLMFEEGATVGRLQGNPVREDQNEAGRLAGVDMAINVVIDPQKKVVGLWVGDPVAVLEQGAEISAKVYGVGIREQFDLGVASCGGHPKDICLYQAQKGLNLCSHAVKKGGGIAIMAACEQGVGDDVYYDYSCRFESTEAALADFRRTGFRMGAHKCYLFGTTLTRYDVVVESELDADVLRKCHLTGGRVQDAIDLWVSRFPGRPRVAVIPSANTTYFYST